MMRALCDWAVAIGKRPPWHQYKIIRSLLKIIRGDHCEILWILVIPIGFVIIFLPSPLSRHFFLLHTSFDGSSSEPFQIYCYF